MESVRIAQSARKHYIKQSITDEDVFYIVAHPRYIVQIEEYQNKKFYIGFDPSLRQLELVTIETVADEMIVIHAMKLRKSTVRFLEEEYGIKL